MTIQTNIPTKPVQSTIFGNRYRMEGFPQGAIQAVNGIDLFYRSARNQNCLNDLRIICPISSRKNYDWVFAQTVKLRIWMNQQGFYPSIEIKERAEGANEESFTLRFTRDNEIETNFQVTVKLIQP